jgi:hypothetical protein
MKQTLTILIICIIGITLTLGCAGIQNPYDPELTGEWETAVSGELKTIIDFDGLGNAKITGGSNFTGTYTTSGGVIILNLSSSTESVYIYDYTISDDTLTMKDEINETTMILYRKGTATPKPTYDPIPEEDALAIWLNAYPWGITDWRVDDGTITIEVRNNTSGPSHLSHITFGDQTIHFDETINSLETRTTTVNIDTTCASNPVIIIPRDNIAIFIEETPTKGSPPILVVQMGAADIIGECFE